MSINLLNWAREVQRWFHLVDMAVMWDTMLMCDRGGNSSLFFLTLFSTRLSCVQLLPLCLCDRGHRHGQPETLVFLLSPCKTLGSARHLVCPIALQGPPTLGLSPHEAPPLVVLWYGSVVRLFCWSDTFFLSVIAKVVFARMTLQNDIVTA